MARLNFVLHNQSFFPYPRLALNESLARANRLPVEVELHATIEQPVRLKASHRIGWELNSHDLRLIDGWEQQLKDHNLLRTTFVKYQQAVLAPQSRVTSADP